MTPGLRIMAPPYEKKRKTPSQTPISQSNGLNGQDNDFGKDKPLYLHHSLDKNR